MIFTESKNGKVESQRENNTNDNDKMKNTCFLFPFSRPDHTQIFIQFSGKQTFSFPTFHHFCIWMCKFYFPSILSKF